MYAWSDNLFSCWTARAEMTGEFVLLNGDTLFEAAVLDRLLEAPAQPVTVVTHIKRHYDADDMKVTLNGNRLVHVGKNLPVDKVDGESIGMILFRGEGPTRFCRGVESELSDASAPNKWYLSVIDSLAQSMPVWTLSIHGLQWCEVDFPADLRHAHRVIQSINSGGEPGVFRQAGFAWG
jgi:choline kinase